MFRFQKKVSGVGGQTLKNEQCQRVKLKQHLFFFILIWRFSKVFQKFKRAPIMLHFQYFFTEIKTQTSSLILFGAFQEKKFLKTTDMQQTSKPKRLFV